jgi:DNA-binding MarR family transcriptional regulator
MESAATIRRLFVSELDVAAARRLLSLIGAENSASEATAMSEADRNPRVANDDAVQRAREALAFRERRLRSMNGRLVAEAPFVMLLALYAAEEWEPAMTTTRLGQLTALTPGTTARWLEVLASEGWIERRGDASDGRKTLLSLSVKARQGLQDLFTVGEPG